MKNLASHKRTRLIATCIFAALSSTSAIADDFAVLGGEVPESVEIFYDQIVNRLGGTGPNADKISQALAENWQTRPNPLNPVEGTGLGAEGVSTILGF